MFELLSDHTFRTVLFGTCTIGAVSGALGCFAYLRKESLIGDVVSHSSLLGIMLAFLASYWISGEGSKSLWVLIPGAILAGVLALVFARLFSNSPRVREDSSLGVMLALFFGTGLLLLHWVQRADPIPGRRGLESYLFGMAASMTRADLVMIATLGCASLGLTFAFWKELKLFSFDPLFCESLGFRSASMDLLLIALLVVGIVIGIQCVGVILMIALLITPAATARQWTRSLGAMVGLAAAIGMLCGGVGSIVSATFNNLPTGPVIVLSSLVLFGLSLLFSPRRGLIARVQANQKSKWQLKNLSGGN